MAKPTIYTRKMFEEYADKGFWQPTTLSDIWNRNGRDYPNVEAIVDSSTRLTWGKANQWIDKLAAGFLELGIEKDEVIVIQLPNCIELCLLRVSCERAGLLCLPISTTWRHHEMEYVLRSVEAVGVVIPWKYREFDHFAMIQEIRHQLPKLKHVFVVGDGITHGVIPIEKIVEQPLKNKYSQGYLERTRCEADEFSLVAATTGTTGFPKFIESPICSRMYVGKIFIEKFDLTHNDIIGVFSGAVGGHNHPAYFSAPMVRARVVMLEHFSTEEAFKLIEKENITLAGVAPAQLAKMVKDPMRKKYDLRSLRFWHLAGAPLSSSLGLEVEEKFGCPVVQSYGAMDCGAITVQSLHDPAEVRLFTVGMPLGGNRIRLVDDDGKEVSTGEVGEILVKGPTLVSGYYKDSSANWQVWTKDGWFRTEDLGRLDDDGNLIIVGRKKDMIIRGGQNIYPVEIENLLITHPKVSKVAIVKMPDPIMGEKACAYVILKPGQQFTFEEMVSFLKAKKIASFKLPERLEVVKGFPMAAGQKVSKRLLQKDITNKLKTEGKV